MGMKGEGKGGGKGGGMGMGKGKGGMRNDHLVFKRMMITHGPYKGYEGHIKEATDAVARIELQSNRKIVAVNISDLMDLDASGSAMRNAAAGPVGDMRPPPTPSYAPNTPSHERDIMATPSRDGTMTPGRWQDAWDPDNVVGGSANTPGSDDRGMGTPGHYQNQNFAPDYNSFSPAISNRRGHNAGPETPGTYHGNTPLEVNPSTPGAFTPGSAWAEGNRGAPTPTPQGATPHQINTPGGHEDAATPGGWVDPMPVGGDLGLSWLEHAEHVEVEIIGGAQKGSSGVILGDHGPNDITVVVMIGDEELDIKVADIKRCVPGKKDLIKVVSGVLAGETGSLIGIDGDDGIVKMDTNSDIKILELECLGKRVDI